MSEEQTDFIPEAGFAGIALPRAHDFLTGHGAARETILGAFRAGRLGHAWLISGEEGIGKSSFAWHFARQLVTTGKIAPGYRASAELLAQYARGSHPFVEYCGLPRDEKSGFKTQIPIERIRDLGARFSTKLDAGSWRVIIVDPAEALSNSAQNALLKLLEEPPARHLFFLISHEPGRLLPTTRSRCQHLALNPLGQKEMGELWQKLTDEPLPDARVFSLAGGSMNAALRLALDVQSNQDKGAQPIGLQAYDAMLGALGTRPLSRSKSRAWIETIKADSRAETFARARWLLGLLYGRIARIICGEEPGTKEEEMLAGKIAPRLGEWAALGLSQLADLAQAAELNLDPEAVLYDKWLEIDAHLTPS